MVKKTNPFDVLSHELGAAELGFRRITNAETGEFAVIPECLPNNESAVADWEKRCLEMHQNQDALEPLPVKPDELPRGPRNPDRPPPHRLDSGAEPPSVPSKAVAKALGVELKRG